MALAFSAGDAAYWGLAFFLVLLGVGSLFALVKLGQLFDKVSSLVGGAERSGCQSEQAVLVPLDELLEREPVASLRARDQRCVRIFHG